MLLASLVAVVNCASRATFAQAAEKVDADEQLLQEHEIQATAASIGDYLRALNPTADQKEWYVALITQLGNSSFDKREAAQRELLRMPATYNDLLKKAAQSDDAEIRLRAKAVFAALKTRSAQERRDELLAAVCSVVRQRELKGLAEPLIITLPTCKDRHMQLQITDALKETVTKKDEATVNRSLQSDVESVRIAAVVALDAITGDEPDQHFLALLNDANERVRFEAALARTNRGDRRGLSALVKLLASPDRGVRSQSIRILSAATGEKFGYAADASLTEFLASVKKWETWMAGAGTTAELTLPVDRPRLFTEDLIVHFSFDDDHNSNEVRDKSGKGNPAKLIGAKRVKDADRGEVCQLSGSHHIALPPGAISDLRSGTVALWLRIDKTGDQQILNCVYRSGEEDIHVQFRTGGTSCLFAYLGSHAMIGRLQTDKTVKHGEWMHAAFTWSTDQGAIYVNGEQIGASKDANKTLFIPKTNSSFWIGRDTREAYPAQDLCGAIDELMVFGRALSATEIKDLFNIRR